MSLEALEKLTQALDYQNNYERKVREAADYVKNKLGGHQPVFGLVLGSGLGDLAESIEDATAIPYSEIPHFPITTIVGHEGKMLIGNLKGVPIIGLKGRKHYYEVADEPFNTGILQTVFPVHVLAELGVKNYFVTNAAGGLNLNYLIGDPMIINTHINLLPNPLLGRHHEFKVENHQRVERFQPMNQDYDSELSQLLWIASGQKARFGTYLAVTGPSYETKGESIAFRDGWKADAVGMSTANEVIIAKNRGMKVVGFSCITNKIAADGTNATNHEEVKAILNSSEVRKQLSDTVKWFFKLYKKDFLR